MNERNYGILINNAGKGNYTRETDIENVIRYAVRQNEHPKDDLVAWGGLGITEFDGIGTIVRQFKAVQKTHTRKGNFGRFIDHEEYSLSHGSEQALYEANADLDSLARRMAYNFYDNDHCQVIYAVHHPKEGGRLHFHFAVNTVNFINGNKRRENYSQNREREKRLGKIVAEAIGEP